MQRSYTTYQQILRSRIQPAKPCHVFINHRRIDTNKNVAGLLYDHLSRLRLRPFLDSKSMKPGDNLYEKIETAINDCKVGLAVFSPHYCDSYSCLRELSMMVERRKKFIPIFVDMKPSELRVVMDNGNRTVKDMFRFNAALEEAKYTVGITFDSSNGDWSNFLTSASDAVMKNLLEVDGERLQRQRLQKKPSHFKLNTNTMIK